MPIYFFWGEDDFLMNQAVDALRQKVLDPTWVQFNFHRYDGADGDAVIEGLNQIMTPVFGAGDRLVWLAEAGFCQTCSESLLKELQRTLPAIPDYGHLLITSSKKPDKRLKSTKLLQDHGQVREFSLLSVWDADLLTEQVRKRAQEMAVHLDRPAVDLLAIAVGNDSRRLWNELEKLKVYQGDRTDPITKPEVARLVTTTTQNSLQLAQTIREGKTGAALGLIQELLARNEPALRIVATLIGQFRIWTTIQVMVEDGEQDEQAIAKLADIANPKRLYFLKKELKNLKAAKLLKSLPLLLELEIGLKRGAEPEAILQRKIIELCQLFI